MIDTKAGPAQTVQVFWQPMVESGVPDDVLLWPQITELLHRSPRSLRPLQSSWAYWGQVVLVGLVYGAIISVVAAIDPVAAHLTTLPEAVRYLLRLLPWLWLALLIHELGHLLAAQGVGYPVSSLLVYPLSLIKTGDRWTLGISRSIWSGSAFVFFKVGFWPTSVERFYQRQLVVALAGPLASLLWAFTALLSQRLLLLLMMRSGEAGALAAQITIPPRLASVLAVLLTQCGFWASAAAFIVLLTPLGVFTSTGDLRLAWNFWRRTPWAREQEALCYFRTDLGRPGEWSPAYLDLILQRSEGVPAFFELDWIAFAWASDTDDQALAGRRLEQLLIHLPTLNPTWQALLWCEVAVYCALQRDDLSSAQAALSRVPEALPLEHGYVRLRAEASVLLLEGRRALAFAAARAGEEALTLQVERRPVQEGLWTQTFLNRANASSLQDE
jgi:uncharacterized protein (DUF2132 family)